jgi:kynureninase
MYVAKDLQARLGNPISGWMGQEKTFNFDLDYAPTAGMRRFLSGTPSVLGLAAIEGVVDLALEAGMEKIRAKSVQQTNFLIELYDAYLVPLGFRLNSPRDPKWRGSHIIFGHDDGWRIDQALIEEMNVLPDFRQPDNIRFGVAPLYNSFVELYTAVTRLKTVVEERRYEKYSPKTDTVT